MEQLINSNNYFKESNNFSPFRTNTYSDIIESPRILKSENSFN